MEIPVGIKAMQSVIYYEHLEEKLGWGLGGSKDAAEGQYQDNQRVRKARNYSEEAQIEHVFHTSGDTILVYLFLLCDGTPGGTTWQC